ncbi:hypothetical protein HF325_006326 [Metschnikowia pulcherrima]|uniref:Uncharacterized protein n=1 Tax=Metschnikowia pulcherrima TaxID=27326 RepID=A0A8H7GMD7_9ASCO|nr:hypothetical protein HF325_006326 [Metschnikowia pulcherrima]
MASKQAIIVFLCLFPIALAASAPNVKDSKAIHIESKANKTLEILPKIEWPGRDNFTNQFSNNDTQYAEELLEWYHNQLLSFIHETHFDTFRFEVVMAKLSIDLSDIMNLAQEVVLHNNQVSRQLQYVAGAFDMMMRCLLILNFYDFVGTSENYVVNRVVDLHVRILKLHTSHGSLNTDIKGCEDMLMGFWLNLDEWQEALWVIPELSLEVQTLIDEQVAQARARIRILFSQIPRKHN